MKLGTYIFYKAILEKESTPNCPETKLMALLAPRRANNSCAIMMINTDSLENEPLAATEAQPASTQDARLSVFDISIDVIVLLCTLTVSTVSWATAARQCHLSSAGTHGRAAALGGLAPSKDWAGAGQPAFALTLGLGFYCLPRAEGDAFQAARLRHGLQPGLDVKVKAFKQGAAAVGDGSGFTNALDAADLFNEC